MAKKTVNHRKSKGGAGIATIEDSEFGTSSEEAASSLPQEESTPEKPPRKPKPKAEPAVSDSYSVADVRKAASFVNSIGGLDKAIAVLQILKVAKEVQ